MEFIIMDMWILYEGNGSLDCSGTITISISKAQIYMWIWSNALYIKYHAYLIDIMHNDVTRHDAREECWS
jgi:hypothetical protein